MLVHCMKLRKPMASSPPGALGTPRNGRLGLTLVWHHARLMSGQVKSSSSPSATAASLFFTRSKSCVFHPSSLVMLSYSAMASVNFWLSPTSFASTRACMTRCKSYTITMLQGTQTVVQRGQTVILHAKLSSTLCTPYLSRKTRECGQSM